jgi:amino acid transporter
MIMESNKENLVFTRKTSGLVKGLSWKDIFILVISAPAGSGILYYSVSTVSSYPGGNVGVSFLIGMALFLPVIFLAALSSYMIPRSSSLYVLISRSVNPAMGFLSSALFFIGYTLSIGVVAYVVTRLLGGIFANFGIITNSVFFQDFGALLQLPIWSTVGGCFLVILTWLIVLKGVVLFRNIMRILFYITMIAIIIAIIMFAVTVPSSAAVSFNKIWGDGTFENIMNLATQHGWVRSSFSWESTFALLLVVMFSYGGLELVSYASGETAKQQKKNVRAYVFAGLVLGLLYSSIAFSVSHAYGDFIESYDYAFNNCNAELSGIMIPIAPSIPFYISSLIPNPWIGLILSICISLWLITTMIPYFFAPSRIIFALAMDRVLPESFANVSVKTGAPTKASHITLFLGILGVLFSLFDVGTVLGTILFCALFVYWLYGLGAINIPYNNPDIYEPCPIKKTFLKIPIITWVGGLVFAIGWFVIIVSVKQMTVDVIIAICVLMGLLLLYFYKSQAKLQRMDSKDIFAQLPPE